MDGDDIGAEGPADGVGGREEAELGEGQRQDDGGGGEKHRQNGPTPRPQDAADAADPAGGRAGGFARAGSSARGRRPGSAVVSRRKAKGGGARKPANANNTNNRGTEPTGTAPPGGGILSPTGLSAFLTQCSLLLGHAAWCRRARRPCPFDEASVAAAHGLVRDGYLRRGVVPGAAELDGAAGCVSLAGELLRIDRAQAGAQGAAAVAKCEEGADPDRDGAARYRSMEAARMREAADAAPRPRVERYEGGVWVTAHVDQRRPRAEKPEGREREQPRRRESAVQRPGEGAERGAEAAEGGAETAASSDPDPRRSAASIIEKSRRSARRLLEARELVSSIARACAGRSIVLDGGDGDGGDEEEGRANIFVESLVGHYRPEYGALTARRLRDALRSDAAGGRGRRRATRGGLEGHLPAVIRRTDGLMEEYRRKIECMKRKRGNVPDGDEPWGGRRGGGGREGPSPDGHRATLQAYREEYWPTTEEETEHSPRRPGLKTAGEGPAGNAARSCRGNDGGLSDPDMLDGEEGSSDSSSDDDGLDLYPAGARRPVKRLRAEDNDDSEVDEPRPAGARRPVKRLRAEDGDDSDIDEPHPAGAKRPVKWLRAEDSDDSDVEPHPPDGEDRGSESDGDEDDEDPSDSNVPYSVRVERGRGGSTKYGTESNNYNTSHFDEDTPRGELLTRVLERYTKERETVARVKRSRLLEFLDEARAEDPGRYGPVEMDPGWLSRRLGKEHKKRRPGAAPHKGRALHDEMYRRYSAVRRGLPPGAKVPPGCIEAIVEAVRAENPLVDLGSKVVSVKTMLNLRYAREFPESKGATGQKLMSTWDPEARRRRERLYNEITLRYKRFKDANPKRIQEDTLGRIIRETMDDLDIHEFEVVPGSIRGRLQRKSLHVQKLGGTDRYHELDGPLVATLNGWLARGVSVTRADGLNLANTLLRGNDLGDGNEVALGAYWWRAFLNRNGHRLNCEGGGSFGR